MAKLNPINPLNWFKSMQDWFAKTEKSSGFRPILIFVIIIFSFAIVILKFFPSVSELKTFACLALYCTVGVFLITYLIKCFQDPDFCRSETHIQKMKKIDLEVMGSDRKPIDGNVIDSQPESLSGPKPKALPLGGDE